MTMLDVLVVGKGPAALACAAAVGERGLSAALLGPVGDVHWPATYGVWADEMAGYPPLLEEAWPVAVVHGERTHRLRRTYGRVDNERMAAWLCWRCARAGVMELEGHAAAMEPRAASTAVVLRGGGRVEARVVVDATGHRPALLHRRERPAQAYQTAIGWTVEADEHPFAAEEAVLMDWRDGHLAPEERGGVPTFLYAYPLRDGRLFVEETALAARPAVPIDRLEARLRRRLAGLGVRVRRIADREEVWIPMGGALPVRDARVVGFGAAGGFVHPATGYSIARSLAAAPVLAAALAESLGAPGATPERAVAAGWDSVWPADRRRRSALFRFGMEQLLRMQGAAVREFFDAFFALPDEDWRGYLGDRLSAREVSGVMARLFARAPGATRRRLAVGALGPGGRALAASLLTGSA
ncbi:MAG TPA: lycopene cyclase family protein [Longimicrobium sp.]|jgi:lycopene cyclase-like protein